MVDWGVYNQPGFSQEIDSLGARLSVEIDCPVHYPAYNKNLFECRCGVIFPLYLVKGQDWGLIKQRHIEGRKMLKV